MQKRAEMTRSLADASRGVTLMRVACDRRNLSLLAFRVRSDGCSRAVLQRSPWWAPKDGHNAVQLDKTDISGSWLVTHGQDPEVVALGLQLTY